MPERPKGKRHAVVLPPATFEKLEHLAQKETRSISSMIAILVDEAIRARESKDA